MENIFLPLTVFVFVAGITPGPNNMMLAVSGVNFGYRRTIPHIMGVALGFPAQVAAVALGLGAVAEEWPGLSDSIKWIGSGFLLYLAWRVFQAGESTTTGQTRGRPMTFLEAALFQWINPKALVISTGIAATFLPAGGSLLILAWVILTLVLISIVVASAWAVFGMAVGRLLRTQTRVRWFNRIMGLLLAATVAWLLI